MAAALGVFILVAIPACADDPSALWKIVHDVCVPGEVQHSNPAPCTAVAMSGGEGRGWAVLKDRNGATQLLLIPTARITGIEDPAVLAPDAPNYWQDAWAARSIMLARLGHDVPRDAISLAVNAPTGRTQNQLHIHIDCIRPDIHDALLVQAPQIGAAWAALPNGLAQHPYLAMRLDGADLGANDPFRLLAAAPGVGPAGLATRTLVVVGATFPDGSPGFYLLADAADPASGDRASGEELQDHDCRIAATSAN
jgi:CDP-diacylglycerol pyrophosphatase